MKSVNSKNNILDLSIIMVSFNTKDLTVSCLNSIVKNTKGIKYEIVVIDNASEDGSFQELKNLRNNEQRNLKIIKNKRNLGFAAGNNQGWKVAKGKYILFLNTDAEILDNTLSEMVHWMNKNQDVGVASCMLKSKNGLIQPTGGYFPTILSVFSWMTIQDFPFVDKIIKPFHPLHGRSFFSRGEEFYKIKKELDWVTGAFLLTRLSILKEVGGWDETYFMYLEDVDLCYRIKKRGRQKVWYLPQWSIVHLGGGSSTSSFPLLSEYSGIKRFYKKFYPSWQYPILKFLLKLGALGRIVLFWLLSGRKEAEVYVKAFGSV